MTPTDILLAAVVNLSVLPPVYLLVRWLAFLRYVREPWDGPIPDGDEITLEGTIVGDVESIPRLDDPSRHCCMWVAQQWQMGVQDHSRYVRHRPFLLERTNGETMWIFNATYGLVQLRVNEDRVDMGASSKAPKEDRRRVFAALAVADNEDTERMRQDDIATGDDREGSVFYELEDPQTFVPTAQEFNVMHLGRGDSVTLTGVFQRAPIDAVAPGYRGDGAGGVPTYHFKNPAKSPPTVAKTTVAQLRRFNTPWGRWTLWVSLVGTFGWGILVWTLAYTLRQTAEGWY